MLKYQHLIDEQKMEAKCPADHCKGYIGEAFRWCNSNLSEKEFLPTLLADREKGLPPRVNSESDFNKKCKACGLSLFNSEEKAINNFRSFPKRTKENLGFTHLAKGSLDEKDGLASKVENSGHFSFYEYENADLSDKFAVTATL